MARSTDGSTTVYNQRHDRRLETTVRYTEDHDIHEEHQTHSARQGFGRVPGCVKYPVWDTLVPDVVGQHLDEVEALDTNQCTTVKVMGAGAL